MGAAVGDDWRPPAPAASADPAEWLVGRIDLLADHWVAGQVGEFDAYARIFHPLGDGPAAPRWADVATAHGRTMHASADWYLVSSLPGEDQPGGSRGHPAPRVGTLQVDALAALCDILGRHTGTPRDCCFALWEGLGSIWRGGHLMTSYAVGAPHAPSRPAPPERRLDDRAPRFSLPMRGDYLLYRDALDAACRVGDWPTENWFLPHSPNMMWPADHAWFVATDVDDEATVVGGSRELIDEIVASNVLEAWPIAPDAPGPDLVNT